MIFTQFKIDPDGYVGRPGMVSSLFYHSTIMISSHPLYFQALDIFLYKTGAKIELLQDLDMVHFFEDAVKGE